MISKIKKGIFTIFITIFLFVLIIFSILKYGLNFENISFCDVNISKFYIKLDKKLVINLENVQIPIKRNSNENKDPKEEILKISKKIVWLDRLFEKIDIKNLKLLDEILNIKFENDNFFIDTKYIKLNSEITPVKGGAKVNFKDVFVKDYDINASGILNADLVKNIYDFNGTILAPQLKANLNLDYKDDILNYNFNDINSTDLKPLLSKALAKLKSKDTLIEWICDRNKAQEYNVEFIKGKIDIKNENFYLNDIIAKGKAKNILAKFNDKADAIIVENADISLKNNTLNIDANNAKIKEQTLKKANVALKQLFKGKLQISISSDTNATLSKTIFDILRAYNIDIPIYQKNGNSHSKFNLDLNFKPFKVVFNGDFGLKNSTLSIAGADFKTKNANISIKDDNLYIKNTNLSMPLFDANLNGKIDLKKKSGSFDTIFNKININSGKTQIINAQNIKSNIAFNIAKDGVHLDIPALNTKLKFGKNNTIEISNVKDLLKYSTTLKEFGVENGNIKIDTPNFKDYDVQTKNAIVNFPLRKKDKTPYNKDDVDIKVRGDKITGQTKSGLVSFSVNKGVTDISIKNLDFLLKIDDKKSNSDSSMNLNFKGTNSSLVLADLNKTLEFDSFNGKMQGKNISFNANAKKGILKLELNPSKFTINANNISSETLNSFIGSKSFENGTFNLNVNGPSTSNFKGEITIKNTFLKDYVLYQKLLSFLNSVPSLLVFKTPDFNSKGFSVKDGKILFGKKNDILKIDAINLKGTSADIGGAGDINFKNKKINIDLEIKYLKDASSIIGKIPLVGQIILGKDKTISTVIEIRGTLDKPTYQTQVVKDVLKTPFNLIKNTLTLPFSLFESGEKPKQNEKKVEKTKNTTTKNSQKQTLQANAKKIEKRVDKK